MILVMAEENGLTTLIRASIDVSDGFEPLVVLETGHTFPLGLVGPLSAEGCIKSARLTAEEERVAVLEYIQAFLVTANTLQGWLKDSLGSEVAGAEERA